MKPSRSLRPNHSWLRNFFVVMGVNLRAGWGAKYFAQRRMLLGTENVYSRAADGSATISLNGWVLASFPRRLRCAETNPPFRSIPFHPRETKHCNDIAKCIGWMRQVEGVLRRVAVAGEAPKPPPFKKKPKGGAPARGD